jgi:hypothetical protein
LASVLLATIVVLLSRPKPEQKTDNAPANPSKATPSSAPARTSVQLELERKLLELDRLRKTDEFKYYGLGLGGPYGQWDVMLDKSFSSFDLTIQERVAVEEIKAMSREYVRTSGEDSDLTRFMRNKVEQVAGLKAKQAPAAPSAKGELASSSPKEVVVGRWRDRRPPDEFHSVVEISKSSQGLRMVTSYRDGGKITEMLKESPDSRGRKLEDRPDNDLGEYFILTSGGDLQYWSGNRMYYTAERY